MSGENVENLRRAWEAMSRGDLDPGLNLLAPDVELDLTTGRRMDADIHRGPDGVRSAYEIWASSWESMVMEAKEIIDAGKDQLVVQVRARGHSEQTGLDFEIDLYWVYALRDAKVVRIREFETRLQAFEAVGLQE